MSLFYAITPFFIFYIYYQKAFVLLFLYPPLPDIIDPLPDITGPPDIIDPFY